MGILGLEVESWSLERLSSTEYTVPPTQVERVKRACLFLDILRVPFAQETAFVEGGSPVQMLDQG